MFRFVGAALHYYKFILDELDINGVTNPLIHEGKETQDAGILLVMTIREIFWNFSDRSCYFGEKLAETDLFQLLMIDLEYILKDTLETLQVSTVVPAKSDSDEIFCLQLLSKTSTCSLHLS